MVNGLRLFARSLEDRWFDKTRSVQTSEPASLAKLTVVGGAETGSLYYLPVRAATARLAMRDLPVNELSGYTFIDLGSGRGRMLFVAAEYPFRQILGVEFATELHQSAEINIGRFRRIRRHGGTGSSRITSLNADAAGYAFPDEKLVLFLFNPFGPDVFRKVLANLRRSLEQNPRHVVLVLLYPELAPVLTAEPWLQICRETPRYNIYQARTSSGSP